MKPCHSPFPAGVPTANTEYIVNLPEDVMDVLKWFETKGLFSEQTQFLWNLGIFKWGTNDAKKVYICCVDM